MAYKLSNINDLFRVKSDGAIEFGTSGAGTATYVLTSAGPNASPTWTEPTTGNVTGSGTLNKVVRWTTTGRTIGDGPITFATNDSTFAGNVTTDGIFKVDTAPDSNILEVDQSGRKMALKTSFAANTTDSFWALRVSTGNVDGSMTDALVLKPLLATFAGNVTIETGINLESGTLVIKNATSDSSGLKIFQDSSDASKIHNNYNGTLQLGVNNTTSLTLGSSNVANFAGNISFPNSDLSSSATPTNFGVYNSEVRLIDTPNGGLQKCRVITDNYGEWILVGRFAANAMNTIANGATWSSVSGLSLGTAQNETTQFSADFGDSFPTEVRIMGATDFTKWRDTRTIDFVYKVPEGRKWKYFFSGGAANGMTSVGPNHSGNNKFGWNINGSYDGFGRWANPLQTSVGMSDGNVTNPSAAYTTATSNAFAWDGADDAKITVTATRTFSGQDSYSTSGFGNDDNTYGFFDEYPNEVINMGGGTDFSSAAWVLIKLTNAMGGGGGYWAADGNNIYNTNSANVTFASTAKVGIGTPLAGETYPRQLLDIRESSGTDYPKILVKYDYNNTSTAPTASLLLSPGQFSSDDTAPRIIGYRTANFASAAARSAGLIFGVSQNNVAKEAIRILENQNVGIGTDVPGTKLQVANAGEVIVRSSMTAADGYRGGFEADNQHTGGTIWSMFSTNSSDGYFGGGKYVIANESMGGVDANTTAKFVIDGSGNAGIGTTSPLVRLQLERTVSAATSRTAPVNLMYLTSEHPSVGYTGFGTAITHYSRTYQNSTKTEQSKIAFTQQGDSNSTAGSTIDFYTKTLSTGSAAPELRMRINYNGKVGIGTTSPQQLLHISNSSGDFSAEAVIRGSTSTGTPKAEVAFKRASSGDGATLVLRSSNSSGTIADAVTIDTSQNIKFKNDNTTELGVYVSTNVGGAVKRIRMRQGGEIHFGDTALTNPLGITEGAWDTFTDQDFLSIYARNKLDIYTYPNGATKTASIGRSDGTSYFLGNVGVGDTAPASLSANTSSLTVNSTRTDLSGGLFQKSNGTIKFQQYWSTDGIQCDVITGNYRWRAANTVKMALVTSSGTLTVVGDIVAFGNPSDKRLKENIKPIESALDKVSKLQGVTFDWKKSDSILDIKEDIGFIAQDVQKVLPELVRENKDGMLSMRHQGVAPILLEAIKELKAEIEELKKQIK